MKKKTKKRAFTLFEMMIVIFLIGLIGSVIGINMKGSLDEGKAFKTRHAQQQLKDILLLEVAKSDKLTLEQVAASPKPYVKKSSIAKEPEQLLKDGWGAPFTIVVEKDDLTIISENLDKYENKKGKKLKKDNPSSQSAYEDEDY